MAHRTENLPEPKGKVYTPVPAEQRKHAGPRYRGEQGQWFGTKWYPELRFLSEDDRERMPETRPDELALSHRMGCLCDICKRPAVWALRRRLRH